MKLKPLTAALLLSLPLSGIAQPGVGSKSAHGSYAGLSEMATEEDALPQAIRNLQYMELEDPFELGFDTADYLPEDFDPNEIYVDLEEFVLVPVTEEEPVVIQPGSLPEDFDPYAAPKDVMQVSYLDPADQEAALEPGLEVEDHLPEDFDPYETESRVYAQTVDQEVIIVREPAMAR